MEGGTHTLAAFAHRLVRQSHQVELRHAAQDLDLDVDIENFDSLESDRIDAGDQGTSSTARSSVRHARVSMAGGSRAGGADCDGFGEKT
jgi:hypothetical protein